MALNVGQLIASLRLDDAAFRDSLNNINNSIRGLAGRDVNVNVNANTRQARANIDALTNSAHDNNININANANFREANRELRQLNAEIRAMQNQFKLAEMQAMMPFKRQLMEVQKEFLKMGHEMGSFKGTTNDFMTSIEELGAKQKKINDQMINANKALGASMIQTAATLLNSSSQASKIAANYTRMRNPLLQINNAALSAANGLQELAHRGNAAVLSLRMLGPNASMKQLSDMQMQITQGQMRFQAVSMASAGVAAVFYGGLAAMAMKTNKEYKKAFQGMGAAVMNALKPLVAVFADVMIPVFKFITSIANMAVAFSKAHPVIAKVVASVLLLVPALMLILSPLSIGIGLFNGMLAALNSVWIVIEPLITGLAAMSATVWIVAAAIGIATVALVHLWKTNASFRNAVIKDWDAVKNKAIELFGWISKEISPVVNKLESSFKKIGSVMKAAFHGDFSKMGVLGTVIAPMVKKLSDTFHQLGTAVNAAFHGDFSKLGQVFVKLIPVILSSMMGGIPRLIMIAAKFMPAIAQGLTKGTGTMNKVINSVINSITKFLTTQFPKFILQGVTIINNLVKGIVKALPVIVKALTKIVTAIIPLITKLLPVLLNAGVNIIMALVKGISKVLPTLIKVGLNLLNTLIDVVMKNLPLIIDAGIEIINALIDGIIKILPQIIDTALQLINQLADALIKYLPTILDAGIKILMALIDGIVKILPKLIDTAINLIMKIVDTLITLLPKIIDAGIKILIALIEGIVKILPKLIATAIMLIVQIIVAVVKNLPKILEAGGKIIIELVKGIIKLEKMLFDTIKDKIVSPLIDKFKSIDLLKIGTQMVQGLIDGISSMAKNVGKVVKHIADGIPSAIKRIFQINSPSRVMHALGQHVGQGFANGISATQAASVAAAKKHAAAVTKEFNAEYSKIFELAKAKKITQTQEIKMYDDLSKKRGLTSAQRLKAEAAAASLRTKEYNDQKKHIEALAAAGKISRATEIKDLEVLSKKYKVNSTDRLNIEKEINKLKADASKDEYDAFNKKVQLAKDYDKLSLSQEIAAYVTEIPKLVKGSQEYQDAQLALYNLQKEQKQELQQANDDYLQKVKDVNDKLIQSEQQVTDEYDNAVKDRTDALKNSTSLFDAFSAPMETTGRKLLANLKSQVQGFASWQQNLTSLKNRGISGALLDELTQMGPQASGQLAQLNKLTDAQLTEYANLYKEKGALANDEATSELSGMHDNTISQIKQLKFDASKEIAGLQTDFVNTVTNITGNVSSAYQMLAADSLQTGSDTLTNLIAGMQSQMATVTSSAKNIGSAIGNAMISGISGAMNGVHPSITTPISAPKSTSVTSAHAASNNKVINAVSKISSAPIHTTINIDGKKVAKAITPSVTKTQQIKTTTNNRSKGK